MRARHLERVSALRERLLELHGDAVLVSSLPNARYLTGFTGSNALVLISQRDVVLLTDFRYETQVADECPDWVRVRIESASLWKGLWEALSADSTIRSIAFESAHLTHRDFQRCLEQGDRWHWRPTEDLVEALRAVKDADEVRCIREAGRVATDALRRTIARVRPGLTELEVCGILEYELRAGGSEAHPFPPIVAAGDRAALPHARASRRAIAVGDFLLIDFGATAGGYCSDVTRTFTIGAASERQRDVHDAVREAHAKAVGGIRAGVTGKAGDALAREVLEARGFGALFGHGLGHGLGLEVHEAPRLSRLAEGSLPDGAVVTIEPGVYVPGWGGVRLEDDVHVTATGAELLTEFPRELLALGA
ncbi:MAG: aminopeptidase P family protein [Gemmatimonadaceae bacterium]|nr:aminopeptidase P family protein [Gemmatimonadaceae bacterium]